MKFVLPDTPVVVEDLPTDPEAKTTVPLMRPAEVDVGARCPSPVSCRRQGRCNQFCLDPNVDDDFDEAEAWARAFAF